MNKICSQIKKNREQNGRDIGNFDCLKSYIRWSILDNSGGRGKNIFKIKIDGKIELVEKNVSYLKKLKKYNNLATKTIVHGNFLNQYKSYSILL